MGLLTQDDYKNLGFTKPQTNISSGGGLLYGDIQKAGGDIGSLFNIPYYEEEEIRKKEKQLKEQKTTQKSLFDIGKNIIEKTKTFLFGEKKPLTVSEDIYKDVEKAYQEVKIQKQKLGDIKALEKKLQEEYVKTSFTDFKKRKEIDKKLQELSYKKQILDEAENTYRQILSRTDEQKGLIQTVINKFKDFIQDNKVGELKKTLEKYVKGEPLNEREKLLIHKTRTETLKNIIDKDVGELVGEVVVGMPKFIVEYALMSSVGGGVLKSIPLVSKVSKTPKIANFLSNNLAGKVLSGSIKGLTGATLNVPMIGARIQDYLIPNFYEINDVKKVNINKAIDLLNKQSDFNKALKKAYLTGAIEYASESMGGLVEEPIKLIQKSILSKFIVRNGIKTEGQLLSFIKKAGGWNGIVGEVFEEEIAELGQAKAEEREYKNPFTTPEGRQRLLVETLGIAGFQGIANVSDKVLQKVADFNNKNKSWNKIDAEPTDPDKIDYLPDAIKEELQQRQQEEEIKKEELIKKAKEDEEVIQAPIETKEETKVAEPQVKTVEPVESAQVKDEEVKKEEVKEEEIKEETKPKTDLTAEEFIKEKETKEIKEIKKTEKVRVGKFDLSEDVKIKVPRKLSSINAVNKGVIYNIENNPNIYTDGVILLEDRSEKEVKEWNDLILKKGKHIREQTITKETVGKIKPQGERIEPIFLGYVKDPRIDIDLAFFDIGLDEAVAINASYYKWLLREGYTLKAVKDLDKPLIIEKNNKEVGLLMPIRYDEGHIRITRKPLEKSEKKDYIKENKELKRTEKEKPTIKVRPTITTVIPTIPKELEFLAQEAKKYKTAKKFDSFEVKHNLPIIKDLSILKILSPQKTVEEIRFFFDNFIKIGLETISASIYKIGNNFIVRIERESGVLSRPLTPRYLTKEMKEWGKKEPEGLKQILSGNGLTFYSLDAALNFIEKIFPQKTKEIAVARHYFKNPNLLSDIHKLVSEGAKIEPEPKIESETKSSQTGKVSQEELNNFLEGIKEKYAASIVDTETFYERLTPEQIDELLIKLTEGGKYKPFLKQEDFTTKTEFRRYEIKTDVIKDLIKKRTGKYPQWDTFEEQLTDFYNQVVKGAKPETKPTIKTKPLETTPLPSPTTKTIGREEGTRLKATKGYFDLKIESNSKKLNQYVSNIKPIDLPEMVEIAKNLSGEYPKIRKLRDNLLGFFKENLGITLSKDIFKDTEIAKRTLAHEIGHLVDWLPDNEVKRGNLLGRILSLKSFLKHTFSNEKGEIKLKEVRKELEGLSFKWRPIPDDATTSLLTYRKSSSELYADAISILINDPDLLKEEAPIFWKSFFDNLDKKPEVKEEFFKIWQLLNQSENELLKQREEKIKQMFKKADERIEFLMAEKRNKDKNLWLKLKMEFYDVGAKLQEDINKAIKQGKKIAPDDNPYYAYEEGNYVSGKISAFFRENIQPIADELIKNNISYEDFGQYLLLQRIINERGEIANPLGQTKETAEKQIAYMKEKYGEETVKKMEELQKKFKAVNDKVLDFAVETGIYNPKIVEELKLNPAYATFQVIDYLSDYVPASLKGKKGTFKEVANPFASTLFKTVEILRWGYSNKLKQEIINFYKENKDIFKDEVRLADRKFNGKFYEVKESTDPNYKTLIVMEEGQAVGYDVDPYIYEIFRKRDINDQFLVIKALSFLNSKWFRPIFTTLNVGFQTFNVVRDFLRFWKTIPNLSFGKALLFYGKAIPDAVKRGFNIDSKLVNEMEEKGILSITFNDTIKGFDIEETDFLVKLALKKGGLEYFENQDKNYLKKILTFPIEFISSIGNTIESLPKIAGFLYLKEKQLSDAEIGHIVRTQAGSPDFLKKGKGTYLSNNVWLFSNAIIQSWAGDLEAMTHPRSRLGYWVKTALINVVPKLFVLLVLAGFFGDDLKKLYEKISEYDKTNYNIIPLGEKDGKAVYLRIPQDEVGRFIGGLVYKIGSKEKNLDGVLSLFTYGADQLPTLNPVFEVPSAWMLYFNKKNPYDFFYGRNVIPENEFKAGFKHSLIPMVKWTYEKLGGRVFGRWGVFEENGKGDWYQEIKKVPIFGDIVSRWLKISDYGEKEKLQEKLKKIEQEQAEKKIKLKESIRENIKKYKENKISYYDALNNILNENVDRNQPKDKIKEQKRSLIKRFKIAIQLEKDDPYVESFIFAKTNEEKVYILSELKKEDKERYIKIVKELRKEKLLSDNVLRMLKKIK